MLVEQASAANPFTVRRQRNSDTVELADKVWFGSLGGSETPRGFRKTRGLSRRRSRIDGLRNWASISPKESREHATIESTKPSGRDE